MASTTKYDFQPLEDALHAHGLNAIYTRDLVEKLSKDAADLRARNLSLATVKDPKAAPIWLRNVFTGEIDTPNPGLRLYTGHWYNSYLRIAAHGYGRGPDLANSTRHHDGLIAPPHHAFDPSQACAPVRLTSFYPSQDDQLPQKQLDWEACKNVFGASRTKTLLHLQITSQHLQSSAPRISKVVAMGLGTLSPNVLRPDDRYRPCSQHVIALSIAEALDNLYEQHPERYGQSTQRVCVLAQDPSYSESDKQLLTEHGFSVVDDPDGLLAIDKNTLIMSAFPSFPLFEIVADILPGGPAAIFDASLPTGFTVDSLMTYNEFATPRVRKMLQGRLIHRLKWDESDLHQIEEKIPMAVHWLLDMKLFFQTASSEPTGNSNKVIEDIQRRENLIRSFIPGAFQLLRQRLFSAIGFT